MCGSTRNVARVARPFPSTIKLSITKQERGKGLAGQTTCICTHTGSLQMHYCCEPKQAPHYSVLRGNRYLHIYIYVIVYKTGEGKGSCWPDYMHMYTQEAYKCTIVANRSKPHTILSTTRKSLFTHIYLCNSMYASM